MQGPDGALLRRARRFDSMRALGIGINQEDITVEVFRILELIHSERERFINKPTDA